MDQRTGQIHPLNGRTLAELAAAENGKVSDFVPVARHPDGTCRRCNGTGAVRRGLFSKRFKPCRCTKEPR
jgi:hypothetical protein